MDSRLRARGDGPRTSGKRGASRQEPHDERPERIAMVPSALPGAVWHAPLQRGALPGIPRILRRVLRGIAGFLWDSGGSCKGETASSIDAESSDNDGRSRRVPRRAYWLLHRHHHLLT